MEYENLTFKIPVGMGAEIRTKVIALVKDLINDSTYTGAKVKSEANKKEFEDLNKGA